MRFAFIAAKKAEHRVTILCRCMRVTRSGFFAWARRGLSARAQRDLVLRTKLRAFHAVNDRRLTLKALEMAVARRCADPGLLHHSDRGCTYTCEDYQTYLAGQGIICSMSRRGDCYDNAVTGCSPAVTRERRMLIRTPPSPCRLSSTNDDDTRST